MAAQKAAQCLHFRSECTDTMKAGTRDRRSGLVKTTHSARSAFCGDSGVLLEYNMGHTSMPSYFLYK